MTLYEILREKLTECRRAGKKVEMSVLQVVLGDASMVEARTGKKPTDEDVEKLIRKTMLGNQETMGLMEQKGMGSTENHARLAAENAYLQALMPESLSVAEIQAALDEVIDAVKGAKNDGQATGIAMKHLKGMRLRVLGDDVATAVKKVRGG
jgi:uncharacterized protein YqeY